MRYQINNRISNRKKKKFFFKYFHHLLLNTFNLLYLLKKFKYNISPFYPLKTKTTTPLSHFTFFKFPFSNGIVMKNGPIKLSSGFHPNYSKPR